MRDTTLCLPKRERALLLGIKKRGFGQGRWNGMGGKPNEGETIEAATVRELEEEVGIKALPKNLEKCAVLEFTFHSKPEWNQRVHVFFLKKWEGEPTESEEMRPQWFSFDEIPYDAMWPDDRYWLPLTLAGKLVKARFSFDANGNTILAHEITEPTSLS